MYLQTMMGTDAERLKIYLTQINPNELNIFLSLSLSHFGAPEESIGIKVLFVPRVSVLESTKKPMGALDITSMGQE